MTVGSTPITQVAEAAVEARAFAAQQKADVETLKRTQVQVCRKWRARVLEMADDLYRT